jgi:DNA (cytosine-5)-methyltransferase 1
VILIACRGNKKVPYLTPTHSENNRFGLPLWKTLSEALSLLEPNTEHHYVNFPEVRLHYYRMFSQGQYWKDLPLEMQKEALGKSFYLGGGKTGFFRRLSYIKPSPTLVTHPAMPASDLAHPTEDRPLSVEEYSCIQEFPKTWKFLGSLLDQYKQIGNAVPIALGEAIGKTIVLHKNQETPKIYPLFPYSRYKNTDDLSWEKEIRKQLVKQEVKKRTLFSI